MQFIGGGRSEEPAAEKSAPSEQASEPQHDFAPEDDVPF
jgi:hypothetical protein